MGKTAIEGGLNHHAKSGFAKITPTMRTATKTTEPNAATILCRLTAPMREAQRLERKRPRLQCVAVFSAQRRLHTFNLNFYRTPFSRSALIASEDTCAPVRFNKSKN